ncbi:hypothetical protein OIU85_007771 [Salix viminalis]|uniref:HTH myb-type domain-containing protein n=1 Tax=Salix viminalis TaxID=40686 RepID=A0A9Q0P9U1_SALVM|nr:hypothetical protein OIU85_007771 [Salix viminalis]
MSIHCSSLRCFPVEHFPKLKQLDISGCSNLESFCLSDGAGEWSSSLVGVITLPRRGNLTQLRNKERDGQRKSIRSSLKLYGRAWRQIEEHVGTKTAVQIRSHAQKFFSKAVRESGGSNTSSVEPIEIPPPRPKRKPMHPYPRKMAHPLERELLILENPLRSSSPIFSISEKENQSPTSVLSAVGSDALGSTD